MGVELRWSSEDDGATIRSLVLDAFAIYLPRIGKPPAPMTLDWCALSARCEVRIAEDDGEVLGVLYAEERGRPTASTPSLLLCTHRAGEWGRHCCETRKSWLAGRGARALSCA